MTKKQVVMGSKLAGLADVAARERVATQHGVRARERAQWQRRANAGAGGNARIHVVLPGLRFDPPGTKHWIKAMSTSRCFDYAVKIMCLIWFYDVPNLIVTKLIL